MGVVHAAVVKIAIIAIPDNALMLEWRRNTFMSGDFLQF